MAPRGRLHLLNMCGALRIGYSASEAVNGTAGSREGRSVMAQHVRDIMTSVPVTVEPQASPITSLNTLGSALSFQ